MSALPWFRLYHRMVDDEKLRLLAFEDRWHFVALCCLKASGLIDEPDSDLRNRKIAVKLGIQVRELEEVARRLGEVGLVDENLNPVAWDELQQRSDNSTERVKKHREKQRANKVKRDETVSVTVQSKIEIQNKKEDIPPKGGCASGDALELVDDWNKMAGDLDLPRIAKLTDDRRRKIRTGLKRNSLDEWQSAFKAIRRSSFCQGENERGWKADFDFLLQPKSFTRLIEGYYDGKV